MNGLKYIDRETGDESIDLQGVFIQIGHGTHTEWLKGSLERNRFSEIIVDEHNRPAFLEYLQRVTVPTVPINKLLFPWGQSTAALSAFDYLIRINPIEIKSG